MTVMVVAFVVMAVAVAVADAVAFAVAVTVTDSSRSSRVIQTTRFMSPWRWWRRRVFLGGNGRL